MARIDLAAPAPMNPTTTVRRSHRCVSLSLPAILLATCTFFGAAQTYGQDVAEAAKQERARKESQQKKTKHVYTEEDLKRVQILTPEDRAQVEAKKNQQPPPAAEKPAEGVDAQSLSPNAPLGDVARRLRQQKQSEKLQRSAQFHLPFADAPVFASPKPPAQPLLAPSLKPLAPPAKPLAPFSKPSARRFAPYQPPVKRSPFGRPRTFMAAPSLVAPSRPPAVALAPVRPPAPLLAPANSAKGNVATVQRGDSLWKLAEQNLGKGLRWHELLSANPSITDPNHIVAGSHIVLPTASASLRASTNYTVRTGDTLSQIAQSQLGHASYSSCLLQANPSIRDANRIYASQVLLLPATCSR
jgi:nucleoid-associated protein YgaU